MNKLIDDFRKLLDVNAPIIFIQNFDFARVDDFLAKALGNVKIIEWNPATGCANFDDKVSDNGFVDLETFLEEKYKDPFYKGDRYLVLKEIHDYFDNPRVKALLQLIAQRNYTIESILQQ